MRSRTRDARGAVCVGRQRIVTALDQGFDEEKEFLRQHLMDSVVHQLSRMLRPLCFIPVSRGQPNGFTGLGSGPAAVTSL